MRYIAPLAGVHRARLQCFRDLFSSLDTLERVTWSPGRQKRFTEPCFRCFGCLSVVYYKDTLLCTLEPSAVLWSPGRKKRYTEPQFGTQIPLSVSYILLLLLLLLPVECLKKGSLVVLEWLVRLKLKFRYGGCTYRLAWCLYSALYKGKGDKCERSNSRGISLLSVVGKLLVEC